MVYEGGGGVEKVQKTVYVVYERPLRAKFFYLKLLHTFTFNKSLHALN